MVSRLRPLRRADHSTGFTEFFASRLCQPLTTLETNDCSSVRRFINYTRGHVSCSDCNVRLCESHKFSSDGQGYDSNPTGSR